MKKKLILVAILLLAIIACGGGGGNDAEPAPINTLPTYSISGALTGATLADVTINLTGDATASTKTSANGNYSFTGLPDGNYTVTPSLTGHTFSPLSTAVILSEANHTDINFVAASNTLPKYSISGAVTGATLANITIRLTGNATASTTTGADGKFSIMGLTDGNYTVTPSLAGYTFSPSSAAVIVSGANHTGINFAATVNSATGAIVADHLAVAKFNSIPQSDINRAKANLRIAYGHTSHGSQLVTGMAALAAADSLYAYNSTGSGGALILRDTPFSGASDLGNPNFTAWEAATRSYLAAHAEVNVIIWSWCGQVSGASEGNINTYLTLMNQLEQDYPNVKFVYMTGHLDGSGSAGNLNLRNQQIRDYCNANGKILFDFADIESYDPDGATNYMLLNADDGCNYSGGNWATQWISANPGDSLTTLANKCGSCAHSQTLNCTLKGRAAWWLWARLAD